jgi:phosphoheptose isomerase
MTPLDTAIAAIVDHLASPRTCLVAFGNGGSSSQSDHLAAEFVVRLAPRRESERRTLPCFHVSTDGATGSAILNDFGADRVFARQVDAYMRASQAMLFGISTSGRSENVLSALRQRGLWSRSTPTDPVRRVPSAIALTGPDGLALDDTDGIVIVRSSATTTTAIQRDHFDWCHEIARRVEEALCPRT